jgi:hypothetical protein
MPIQKAATEAFTLMLMVAMLQAAPPVQYDSQDPAMIANGGPKVAPFALWKSMAAVTTAKIGDLSGSLAAYQSLLSQYSDLLGVNPARLGAQTVSHTSAYAKSVELQQGASRTVDFVSSMKANVLQRWLNLAYSMVRKSYRKTSSVYVRELNGWIEVSKDMLPEKVFFLVQGADAPADEREKLIKQGNALQLAIQMDQANVQLGGKPLEYRAMQLEVLRKAGFNDPERFAPEFAARVEGAAAASGGGVVDAALDPLAATALSQYPASLGQDLAGG